MNDTTLNWRKRDEYVTIGVRVPKSLLTMAIAMADNANLHKHGRTIQLPLNLVEMGDIRYLGHAIRLVPASRSVYAVGTATTSVERRVVIK